MKKIMGLVFCCAVALICSCGGSSGSSDTAYTVTTTVEMPSLPNVATPMGAKASLAKVATDVVAEGVVVQAQDAAGNNIGAPCTTAADGTCTISLTATELEAGVVFTSSNMHSYQQYDSVDIAAADAGTALTAPINAEEDVLYALVAANCGGAIASCPSTIDTDCLHDAVAVLPGDDQPSTDTVDGYMEGLLEAQRNALINNPANATSGLVAALAGDPTAYVADVGASTVSDVPVADAVANSQIGASSVNTAYCTRDSAAAASPWETARAAATTTDTTTFSMAFAGMFEYFPPAQLQAGTFTPESFRAFMTAGPQLTDFFTTMGGSGNDLARNTLVQGFQNGMFSDPLNAPVAMGFIGSTFPTPVGGVIPWTDNAFDPSAAMMGARNAFVEMTNSSSFNPALFTPNSVYSAFQGALADPTRRTTFANGGCSDFVGAFMGNPTGFVPTENFGRILSPPGGSCTNNADCLPCDNCVTSGSSKTCVAGSSKMGSSCSTDSDCDEITICVGPPNSTFSTVAMKNCMCTSGVPTGMGIFTGGGGAPQPYNPAGGGGYTPPVAGSLGGTCGPSQAACLAGLSCTNLEFGGVCVPGTYRFPPGSACTTSDQCLEGATCTSSICTGGSGGGGRTTGMACSFPNECQSYNCMAGICQPMGGGGDLKPDGSACAGNAECMSGSCNSGVCGPLGGAPAGAWCNMSMMCQSGICNFGTMTCGS